MTNLKSFLLPIAVFSLLAGCKLGPDYVRPQMVIPPAYKESAPWKIAEPKFVDIEGKWWEQFGDPQLNELVVQADLANQNIQQAEAQYRIASALAQGSQAAFFPTVSAGLSVSRGNAAVSNAQQLSSNAQQLSNSHTAWLVTSWEPDVWGSIRRSVEAGNASAQASADDLAAARLSIQATLVQDYMKLRITDKLRNLFAHTTAVYKKSLQITQSQFQVGIVTRSDVALAQATLKSAQAQAIDLEVQRSQLEHAIAVLSGKAPAEFTLPAAPLIPGSPLFQPGCLQICWSVDRTLLVPSVASLLPMPTSGLREWAISPA